MSTCANSYANTVFIRILHCLLNILRRKFFSKAIFSKICGVIGYSERKKKSDSFICISLRSADLVALLIEFLFFKFSATENEHWPKLIELIGHPRS